jgi:hypothetical protein
MSDNIEQNRKQWDLDWHWPQDGDEWVGQAAVCGVSYETWKESLVRHLIAPYVTNDMHVLEIAPGHGRWTGFALESAHETADCGACHPALARPDDGGRSYEYALGTRCDACHEDVHAGQFGAPGTSDCAACHPVAETWDDAPLFDHERDSRYALDDNHADLDCSACHVPWHVSGGAEVVRYKPLGVECADCHDDGRGER